MGKIKETLDELNNEEDLDKFLGNAPTLTSSEIMDIQVDVIKAELNRLIALLDEKLYMHQYHKEKLDRETVDFVRSEIKRIIRDFT